MARLVNKQFNSPIGLYSEQNIREVIQRDSQVLANGAVGVNFHNPAVGKPGNLQNSAVLRMLEEEEHRQRSGQSPSNGYSERPLRDQIKWPPPDFDQRTQLRSSFKDVVTPGLKRVAWPPPNEGEDYAEQAPVQSQGGPQYSSQSPNLQNNQSPAHQQVSHAPSQRYPLKPLEISNGTTNYQSSAISPVANQSPLGYRPTTPNKQWAPVHSPVTTPGQPQFKAPSPQYFSQPPQQYQPGPQSYPSYQQPQYNQPPQQYQAPPQQYQHPPQQYQHPPQQYQPPPQQYQPPPQQYQPLPPQYQPQPQQYQPPPQQFNQPQQQYQPPPQQIQPQPQRQISQQSAHSVAAAPSQVPPQQSQPAVKQVEPPPSTITLRQQAPVSQAPPPVVTSQPATATLKGGKHLRGDLKWPPENVKIQMEEENRQRLELARGPACRPRLVRKDYGPFFAQHALNASYPGYKVPPGTQFYEHHAY